MYNTNGNQDQENESDETVEKRWETEDVSEKPVLGKHLNRKPIPYERAQLWSEISLRRKHYWLAKETDKMIHLDYICTDQLYGPNESFVMR